MEFYRDIVFNKFGQFLHLTIDYANKHYFCDEVECTFIGSKKELIKHKTSNCEWSND